MPFWPFWSRRPAEADPVSTEPERRPSFTDADREFIRNALDQFEANGLRIWPDLNRELIVARGLIDIDLRKPDGYIPGYELQSLFSALAAETDSLTWYTDEVEQQFPALSTMDERTAEEMLQEHSYSIFENAGSINLVNEGDSLEHMVYAFAALSNLDVTEVNRHVMKNGLTRVSFQVEGLGECNFEIESRKRPDVTPVVAEMNRIAAIKNLGRYITVPEGSSESETFIFADEATLSKLTDLLNLECPVTPQTSGA